MAARGPWGNPSYSPPGPNYGPYPPTQHPDDSRQRTIFPQPVVQTEPGFYSAALSSVGGFAPLPTSYAQSPISAYPPPPAIQPAPIIPAMLKPGGMDRRPSSSNIRTDSGDFFFRGLPFPSPHHPQSHPHYGNVHHGTVHHPPPPQMRHSQSSPPPPLPHKPFNSPPVPPKPYSFSPDAASAFPIYPQTLSANHRPSGPQSVPAISDPRSSPFASVRVREEPVEDLEFKKALEMSARAAQESARQRQKTLTQEDEDMARAMQESLKLSSMAFPMPQPISIPMGMPTPSTEGSPSYQTLSAPRATASIDSHHSVRDDTPSSLYTSSPPSIFGQMAEDEAFARRMMEEEESNSRLPPAPIPPPVVSPPLTPIPSIPSPAAPSFPVAAPSSPTRHTSYMHTEAEDTPPMYNDVVVSELSGSASTAPSASSSSLLPPTPVDRNSTSSPVHSRPSSALGRSSSATASLSSASPTKQSESRQGRSGSLDSPQSSQAISPQSQSLPSTPNLSLQPANFPINGSSPASIASNPLATVDEGSERSERPRSSSHVSDAPSSAPSSNANQYIDEELLRGVSLGFNPPVIKPDLSPLQGPIPNVIALPYGRCPPFHLKAPSWRDLIKFLARLSGTRLEPTIEAMAIIKTEMRIRVVVNFVKVHQNTPDWHIVLYMTIDQPVPQNHPQKFKYKNDDPSILPFSYTMSSTPAYLREGAEAPISKWYNIPATSGLPHPKLPMSFPDLATYLLDALEDSRRADGSSGMRRLAKLIETCYPADRSGEERSGRDKGVSGWVRGLIGRDRPRSRDRNEHTFDVVTPFVPDEWGG